MKNVKQQLKAERVQEPETALAALPAPNPALKAERVQVVVTVQNLPAGGGTVELTGQVSGLAITIS